MAGKLTRHAPVLAAVADAVFPSRDTVTAAPGVATPTTGIAVPRCSVALLAMAGEASDTMADDCARATPIQLSTSTAHAKRATTANIFVIISD